jgi:hypothetical protein
MWVDKVNLKPCGIIFVQHQYVTKRLISFFLETCPTSAKVSHQILSHPSLNRQLFPNASKRGSRAY